jgi:hypothetical protein
MDTFVYVLEKQLMVSLQKVVIQWPEERILYPAKWAKLLVATVVLPLSVILAKLQHSFLFHRDGGVLPSDYPA